jgi:hypothetical protein
MVACGQLHDLAAEPEATDLNTPPPPPGAKDLVRLQSPLNAVEERKIV